MRKILSITLCSIILSTTTAFSNETEIVVDGVIIENQEQNQNQEQEEVQQYEKPNKIIKFNNNDVTDKFISINGVSYIDTQYLSQLDAMFYGVVDEFNNIYYGMFKNKPFKMSTNDNYIYYADGYIYSDKPKFIDNKMYISIDTFSYMLGYEYFETNEYELIDNFRVNRDYSFTENKLVAHAMGGIGDDTITNSLEAFLENYEKGFRVFEVDLQYTTDGKLVAIHDFGNPYVNKWNYKYDPQLQDGDITYEEFKNNVVFGAYTPLSFEDVVKLMVQYPDVYIIMDTKYVDPRNVTRQFNDIINTVNSIDSTVMNRIIPQVYNYDMFYLVDNIYNFNSYIITLYQMENLNYDELTNFVYENGIEVVVADEYTATKELMDKLSSVGVKTYVHTINDINKMIEIKNKGAYGFYTDFVTPSIYDYVFTE